MDKDFLKKLDEYNEREIYVKIISLDFSEKPRSEIQGYAVGGSINVDGSSAVRRTCSLNMISESAKINELDWALETKFKLEIGLKNFIDKKYGDIIWFPQGTYILTSFGFTSNLQGLSISLQGKDKMCLLDGTVGGNIFASHDFGKLEIRHNDGSYEFEHILIYDIIKNAIHEYALEPYHNIIINDLEDCSVELIDYLVDNLDVVVYNIYYEDGRYDTNIAFEKSDMFDALKDLKQGDITDIDEYQIELIKYVSYGETIGYRLTDLTYPSSQDLILGAGSTITQMLDKLIEVLGEFEYFYDLQGRFVFQRKKIYHNISWNNTITNERETHYDSIENGSENFYEFVKGILIESYNNKPDLNNIKNDYTIWGARDGIDGDKLSVHLRCAIDDKPIQYRPLLNENIGDEKNQPRGTEIISTYTYQIDDFGNVVLDEDNKKIAVKMYDWREIIYRMAYDYSKSDERIATLTKKIANPGSNDSVEELAKELLLWEKTWDTRYVPYYTDLLEFWRLLYDPNNSDWSANNGWNPDYVRCERDPEKVKESDNYNCNTDKIEIKNHTQIPYWIDFCDGGYLEKYKPSNIGRRTKVVNDNEVKAIFFEDTPNILFIDPSEIQPESDTKLSYANINLISDWNNYFRISSQGKSAKEVLDGLLYTHTYYCESISINCIPIYYLEPNVRISVYDEDSGIVGDYIIKSFNIPLAYNGSMSITATKAEELII